MSEQPWSSSSTAADGRRRSCDRGSGGQRSSLGSSLHVVESWRRTVQPLAQLPPDGSTTALAQHASFVSAETSLQKVGGAAAGGCDKASLPSMSARSGLASSLVSREPAVEGRAYPASDPLGFFIKRPVQALARSAAPERTLSLSSASSAHVPATTLTRTPSLSEASSYTGDLHGWSGALRNGTTASSDHCPASPTGLPFGLDFGASLSLSSGPSPTSSPTALRPEDDFAHAPPPPVSLLSALLASHSHHTKALAQQHPSSGFSSAHPPSSAFASPASSMPNSTASSPLGGSIHPHLAQSARQRRFSSGACDMLENVGEEGEAEEAEVAAANDSAPHGQQNPEALVLENPKPVLAVEHPSRRPIQAIKARIGIPSAKPPSIFLAASPAPSLVTPSVTNAARKPSIVFLDDPEIAAKRSAAESTSASTPATSDAATDSSANVFLSTPEVSPAPFARESLARLPATNNAAEGPSTSVPPVRRGLSFAEPTKQSLASPPSTPWPAVANSRPPTPTRKASGLTFAVTAICARPKALGPDKAVGTLEEDDDAELEDIDAGSDDSSSDAMSSSGEDDDDDEESEDEDGLDASDEEEADGYEEDDEGEGSDGFELGEREGARYRYRREALFGQDSDDDSASVGSEEESDLAFDETASVRTKTSGRGSIFSNFSGFAPNEESEDLSSTFRQASLQHRRSSSLRGRAAYARHSPTLPPIDAIVGDSAGPFDLAPPAAAPAPHKRSRQLFSFIRRRDGGKIPAHSPHHAPRLLSNGATGFSPRPVRAAESGGVPSDLPSADEPQQRVCRDNFLPSHLKSEEGKQKEREAELRDLLSSTDGGGAGGGSRYGRCSRHRSPPPSSSGRDRSRDRSPAPARRRAKKLSAQRTPIPTLPGALDQRFFDAYASDTLRPPPPLMHVSDSGARPTATTGGRKARRRSYNHGAACRPKVGGEATPPVFFSEAETTGSPRLLRIKSRPIPTPSRRMVDDQWDGDDGGFP